MTYRGYIEGGIIRPREPLDLPDGTEVEFAPVNGSRDELAAADHAFRANPSLGDLRRQQRVKPIRNIDDLGMDWPEDDFDQFLRELRKSGG